MWESPLAAVIASRLPESGLVLHTCPFVPLQIALRGWIAGSVVAGDEQTEEPAWGHGVTRST